MDYDLNIIPNDRYYRYDDQHNKKPIRQNAITRFDFEQQASLYGILFFYFKF
jgi:hypothetical protein